MIDTPTYVGQFDSDTKFSFKFLEPIILRVIKPAEQLECIFTVAGTRAGE